MMRKGYGRRLLVLRNKRGLKEEDSGPGGEVGITPSDQGGTGVIIDQGVGGGHEV